MVGSGVVKAVTGIVKAIAVDGTERILQAGDRVLPNEQIITGDGGAIAVEFSDGTTMDLGRNSNATLNEATLMSDEGNKLARKIHLKHEKIYKFFKDVLIVSDEVSKKDACKIEHYISKETMDHMIEFIRFIESCPDEYPEWLKHFKYFLKHGKRPEECRKK